MLKTISKEITLKELKGSTNDLLENVNCIKEDQLTFLWFDDFYDGVLNGMVEYQNELYRYEIVTDYTKLIYPRIFALVALTADEFKEEKYWNDLYERLIKEQPENKESYESFFEEQQQKKIINYDDRYVIGYFTQD